MRHVEVLGHLSDLITPELLSTWQAYANFLREERNVMPVLELNANEALGLETSQVTREAASLVTARTSNTGAWLHSKITESVKENAALITSHRERLREFKNTVKGKITELKQLQTPNLVSIERLTKILNHLDSIDDDFGLYVRTLRSSTFSINKELAATELLDQFSEIEKKVKRVSSLVNQLEGQYDEFNSYLKEESQCKAMKSKAMKKIKSFIKGQATEPLTEQEFDALKDSPTDTFDDIARKYSLNPADERVVQFLKGEPPEPSASMTLGSS